MGKVGIALVRGYLVLLLLFLYLPIAVMIVMAFNSRRSTSCRSSSTSYGSRRCASNQRLLDAGLNTVKIALINTVIATALGTHGRPGVRPLQLPRQDAAADPAVPADHDPLAHHRHLDAGSCSSGSASAAACIAMLLGHVALSLPYVIIVVGARLKSFGTTLEEAAATLGATPWQAFWRVTLPMMAPGMVAAALFAFAVSFDQFVISYFLAAPGVTTLPVEIYTAIRKGYTPEINAISTIIIVVSMGLMLLVARFYRFGGER